MGYKEYFISIQGFSSNTNVLGARAWLSCCPLPGGGGGGRPRCGAADALQPRDQAEHGPR